MLITDDFVMLNFPKTGSSFARSVIRELYQRRQAGKTGLVKWLQCLGIGQADSCQELMFPNIKIAGLNNRADQHGTYSQIPACYRDRKIVSIVRNPYSRFMSGYEFRYWVENPNIPQAMLAEYFPQFPDLSVDDYVRFNTMQMIHGRLAGKTPDAVVGDQTVQFIKMFFRHPDDVIAKLTDAYLDSDDVFGDMAEITFLRQEHLREDLVGFLAGLDFTTEDIQYVREREKMNVTRSRGMSRASLWTESSLAYVKDSERMIFRILNARGIACPEPDVCPDA